VRMRMSKSTIGNGTFMISTFVPLDDHALACVGAQFWI
jgi:hypothetical protein